MLNQLGRFELARRVLNHHALVDIKAEVLNRLIGTHESFESALVEYARLLRESFVRENDPQFPAPVLPVVDLAALHVRHTTCTGNTVIRVSPDRLSIFRHWDDSPRDRVLEALHWNEALPDFAALFLDEEALRATGMNPGRCLLRLHGELAVYRKGSKENYYEALYTGYGVFTDFEHDFDEPDWMHAAPAIVRERVAQHKSWIIEAIASFERVQA